MIAGCNATGLAAAPNGSTTRRCSKGSRTWNNRWPSRRRRLDAAMSSAAAIATPEPQPRPPRTEPAKRNRGALPAHLPRVELVVDVEDKACPCCGGTLHVIGEDRAEMLDYVPAQVRVRVIRRPRYGCRACEEAVVQAPAPERPIDGGMATEALLAHVLVNKYADHLPLYRQAQIFARQGVTLDRSTLVQLGRPRLLVAGAVA